MKSAKSVLILSLILLVGAVSNAQKVSSGYDKSINFSGYKSYVFSSTQGARNPVPQLNPTVRSELQTLSRRWTSAFLGM